MFVVPVKCIPWLLAFGGAGAILMGEGDVTSVLMAIVGGVWLFLKYKK